MLTNYADIKINKGYFRLFQTGLSKSRMIKDTFSILGPHV